MEGMSQRKFNRCLKELQKLKDKESACEYKIEIAQKYLYNVKLEKHIAHSAVFEFESRLRSVIIQKSDGSIKYGFQDL